MENKETEEELSFTQYLAGKNIDEERFKFAEPERYAEWANLFSAVHPESFTAMKKFLINPIRRKYPLKKFSS
jgi:hypothetical protein